MKDPKERFKEIQKQIEQLNLEAEQILLEHAGDIHPEGTGKCDYGVCSCEKYVRDANYPGHCSRSHCGHAASYHKFE